MRDEADEDPGRRRCGAHRHRCAAGCPPGRRRGECRSRPRCGVAQRHTRLRAAELWRHGTPAYNYAGSGDAADPQVVDVGRHVLRLHDRQRAGQQHRRPGLELAQLGLRARTPNAATGSTALPSPSSWEQANTQTSPGVFNYDGHWVMFYDAAQSGHASDTGFDCLAVATAPSISPTDVQFSDVSNGPIDCQATGSIDPQPFVDPSTGERLPRLEAERRRVVGAAYIWAQQLNAAGTGFAPGSSPEPCCSTNNTVVLPVGDDRRGPVHGGGRRRLLPRLLGRRVHEHRVLGGDHHLQRAARSVRCRRARSSPRTARCSDPGGGALFCRRRRSVVARLRGVAGRFSRVHELRLRRGPAALRGADLPAQRQR